MDEYRNISYLVSQPLHSSCSHSPDLNWTRALLDNCPAHPDSSELVSDDEKIFSKYLPPGVTSLIQPMDQGVLQSFKQTYKKKLLRQLFIEDENGVSVPQFLKTINMKVVADHVAEAWKEIPSSTFINVLAQDLAYYGGIR